MALTTEEKLTKARVSLLTKKPFFGALAMRLQLVRSETIETTATDGVYMYYKPAFVDNVPDKDVEFAFEHEIMHVVQHAFSRKPLGANHLLWNLACDFVINTLILDAGQTDSPLLKELCTKSVQEKARNNTSEQVYRKLLQDSPKCEACEKGIPFPSPNGKGEEGETCGESCGDNAEKESGEKGQGKNEGKNDSHDHSGNGGKEEVKHTCNPKGCCSATLAEGQLTEEQQAQWKQAIVAAAEYARGRGSLPGNIEDLIGKLVNPTVRWQDIVRVKASRAFTGRWSWTRKSRRQTSNFSLRRIARAPNPKGAVVMVDTSGSISDKELIQFISESVEIMKVCRAPWIDIYLHTVDCYKVFRLDSQSKTDTGWKFQRGGTSHVDVFKKCLESERSPGLIISFTDLATEFPPETPSCEVIWAHPPGCGESISVPFGTKVLVNLSEEQ